MSYQDMANEGKIYKNFLTIVPRDETYLNYNLNPIPLAVIKNDGVDHTPDVQIKITDLNSGKKRFINTSGEGDRFKVNVIIHKNATVRGIRTVKKELEYGQGLYGLYGWHGGGYYYSEKQFNLIEALDTWIKNMTIFTVTTKAVDIPNGSYLISGNGRRKQTYDDYTIWELEFIRYVGNIVTAVTWNNTYANKAIATYNKQKEAKAKQAEADKNKFKKCNYKVLVYSKTKKVVTCVKYLQTLLKKWGFYKGAIDGWYGKDTFNAVKAFQTKWKKKYNIGITGKVNEKTFKVMCVV